MRRSSLFWVGLAALLLVAGFLAGGSRNDGPPLDPDSTGPLGTRALTELLDAFGSDVRRGLPDDGTTTALVLVDRLGTSERNQLRGWVDDGGLLVVADPGSSLSPGLADLSPADQLAAGNCDLAGLENLVLEGESFGRYDSDEADGACFTDAGLAYLVAEDVGDGRIISLGGSVVFTNENLDEGDNAVLAVELLAVDGGETAIVFEPGSFGGTRTLTDLISTPVRWFGAQLLLAFAIYVLWRARRFGRVVAEPQVVEMPGSLLVRATGELSRRSGGHRGAGQLVVEDLDRRLRRHYRIPPDVPVDGLIDLVSAQTPIDQAVLRQALSEAPTDDGTALVERLRDVDTVQAICLGEASPTEAAADRSSSTDPTPSPDPHPQGAEHV